MLKPLYNCTFYKLANNKSQSALLICIHKYCNLCMQLKTYYPQELYMSIPQGLNNLHILLVIRHQNITINSSRLSSAGLNGTNLKQNSQPDKRFCHNMSFAFWSKYAVLRVKSLHVNLYAHIQNSSYNHNGGKDGLKAHGFCAQSSVIKKRSQI